MGVIYASTSQKSKRVKVVTNVDCLPPDAEKVTEFYTTADVSIPADLSERFWHWYEFLRIMEKLGYEVCIDFGKYFYETGMDSPEIGYSVKAPCHTS